jgi:hypothetical protein
MNPVKHGLLFMLLLLSFIGLWRFSHDVRTVSTIGLFSCGVLAGIVIANVIGGLIAKRKP